MKESTLRGVLLIGLIFASGTTSLLMGQVDRATLTGAVTDPSGAAVPGVAVTAININTQVAYKTETNSAGLYSILNLPGGPYK